MMHGVNSPPRNGLVMSRNKREGRYNGYMSGHIRSHHYSLRYPSPSYIAYCWPDIGKELAGVWIDEEFNPSDADRAILEGHLGSLEVRYFVPSEPV